MASYNNFYGNIIDRMFSGMMVTELFVGIAMSGTSENKENVQCFNMTKENIAHCVYYEIRYIYKIMLYIMQVISVI